VKKDPIPSHETVENAEPLFEMRSVSQEFGYRRVLEDVSLACQRGELTLLLGRNGSGKSTLMKIGAGLLRPSQGRILFQGKVVGDEPERFRRAIGMISHPSYLYGDLSAGENLDFFARLGKTPDRRQRVTQALEATGLQEFTHLPVKSFSSGMSKRLNIARLMVLQPQILLLDEPYTGLDYHSTDFFNRYLASFKQKGGTILLISHQIETCFPLCDYIAVLEQRRLKRYFRADRYGCADLIQEYHQLTKA